jgi:Mg-chelatase subunit ChlD
MSKHPPADLQKSAPTALEQSTEGQDRLMSEELCIFMLDCSSSMSDALDDINRVSKIDAAKKGLLEFLRQRINYQKKHPAAADQLAVVTFPDCARYDDSAAALLQPTLPDASHLDIVDRIHAGGGTPLVAAIKRAGEIIRYTGSGLIRLVIISDGEPDDKRASLSLVSGLVSEFGIVVDTVGVGARSSSNYGCYDEAFLRELARLGDGKFVHISDVASFVQYLLNSELERRALLGSGMLLLTAGDSK